MAWYGEPPVWHVERRQGMAFRPITNRRMVSQALNCSSLRTESRVDRSGEIEKLLRVDFRPRWGSKSWRLGSSEVLALLRALAGQSGNPWQHVTHNSPLSSCSTTNFRADFCRGQLGLEKWTITDDALELLRHFTSDIFHIKQIRGRFEGLLKSLKQFQSV